MAQLSDRIAKTLTPVELELLTRERGPADFFGRITLIFERGQFVRVENNATRLAEPTFRK